MSSRDEPTPLADALAAVRAEFGLPAGDVLATLDARWSEVVGEDVATHARLVSVREGVASIAVDSPPWATQLRYLEGALIERANALVGRELVHSITVRVRPGNATK